MKGYKIVLKRRKDQLKRNDLSKYQYLIFGHFDGMKLLSVDSWTNLSPSNEEKVPESDDIEWEFLDELVIKGVHTLGDDFVDLSKDKLYIVLSMLNFNDKITKQDMDSLKNKLKDENGYRCRMLPTISYQDAVVFFWGDNLDDIKYKVEDIRGLRTNSGKKALVTDIYTIVGINQEVFNKKKDTLTENVNISIRVILEAGINVETFWENVSALISNQNIANNKKHIFGNSDIMFTLTGMEKDIFSLFMGGGCFNPGSTFFKNNISQIRTSVHPMPETSINDYTIDLHESTSIIKKEDAFEKFWRKLRNFFAENDKDYLRLTRNLMDMYKMYLSLIQSEHNGQLEETLTNAFDIFQDNIEKNMATFENLGKNSDDCEERKQLFKDMCRVIELFKKYLFGFLQDLRKSDRMFIEESSLTHPSVASATKLVLFYDEYINKLAKLLVKHEEREEDDKRDYHFMIMSGGTNDISAIDLFAYLNPWDKQLKKLIFVLIPERQLFDVKKTLFSLSHECAHFCGKRYREERKELFIKAINNNLCFWLEKGGKSILKSYLSLLMCDLMFSRMNINKNELIDNYKFDFKNMHEMVEGKLNREIEKNIEEKKQVQNTDQIGEDFFVVLNEIMSESWSNIVDDDFIKGIYFNYLVMFQEYFSKLYETLLKEMDCSLLLQFDIEINRFNYYLKKYEEGNDQNGELDIWEELWEKTKQIILLINKEDVFNNSLEIVSTVMKECCADIIAVKSQEIEVDEFIMNFVDDNLDLDECFPRGSKNKFRIALDLDVIFRETGELHDSTNEKIKNLFDQKVNEGMECKFDSQELIDHLNFMINDVSEYDYVLSPTKEYLEIIMNETINRLDIDDISPKGNILQWKDALVR